MASNNLLNACKHDDVEEVRRLLVLEGISAKVDAPPADAKKGGGGWFGSWSSTKSDSSMSPLSAAAEAGSLNVMALLLGREGIDVNALSDGRPPLLTAIAGFVRRVGLAGQLGRDDIAQLDRALVLDPRGPAVSPTGCSVTMLLAMETKGEALEKEAVAKLLPVLDKLIAAGADLDGRGADMAEGDMFDDDYSALHIAARSGLAEVVDFLLDKGASWNLTTGRRKMTPLELATMHGHSRAMRVIFQKHSADTRQHLAHLLKVACRHGRAKVALLIIAEAAGQGAGGQDEFDPDLPGALKELLKHYTGDVAAGFAFLLLAFRPRTDDHAAVAAPELPPAIGARMMETALVEDADPKTMACMCRIAMQHALESRAALATAAAGTDMPTSFDKEVEVVQQGDVAAKEATPKAPQDEAVREAEELLGLTEDGADAGDVAPKAAPSPPPAGAAKKGGKKKGKAGNDDDEPKFGLI